MARIPLTQHCITASCKLEINLSQQALGRFGASTASTAYIKYPLVEITFVE